VKSIIVVDDDLNIRQTIIDILCFEDMVGEPFSSADGVLARISQGDIGLVITDLNMPGLDGIELISAIKNTLDKPFCNVPVIMLTGAGYDSRSAEALEKGASGCLGKPFDIDEFLNLVRATLEGESS
jgi:two-component system C4-dicarboxylate transport response regulator DctD